MKIEKNIPIPPPKIGVKGISEIIIKMKTGDSIFFKTNHESYGFLQNCSRVRRLIVKGKMPYIKREFIKRKTASGYRVWRVK